MHTELGGYGDPGTLVVTRFPIVNVPVCVFMSVEKCVLQRAHSVGARVCVRATACVDETPCIKETPCMNEAPRVRETVCVSERVRMKETACVSNMVCVSETPCVSGTTCANEMVRVSEARCVRGTACVRSLCAREMTVGMRENATACPRVMEWCVSVVTRRCAWVEWRQRRRHLRDKGRVAAVVISKTAPGLPGSEREVRAVLRTRPPRARLRE